MRFAEHGHPAVAIDYFGRTAGVATRDADFPYADHVPLTTPEQVQMDIVSAVAFLRSPSGGACAAVATVGFCFGGRHSWLAAAGGHGLVAAVGFYGMPGERNGQPGPTDAVDQMEAPILALMGGADPAIPAMSWPSSNRLSTRPEWSTRSSPIPGRPTASSIVATRSSPTRLRTPGSARSRSSIAECGQRGAGFPAESAVPELQRLRADHAAAVLAFEQDEPRLLRCRGLRPW